jgi:5'-deoxynucleotidase YfbR-like HD superfamily hydrolase
MAIYLEYDLDLNIDKVTTMLAHHETEEIEIGDITPFDGVSEQEKSELGKVAVSNITSKLKNGEYIKRYVDEFEKRETKEARFAYLCDKLECILWAKKYSDTGRISIETAPQAQIDEVKEYIDKGAKNAGDVFREFHKYKFANDETFIDIINNLEKYILKD